MSACKYLEAIMKSVIRQLDTVSDQLRKLQDAELSEANDQYVDQIVSVYRLLQDQARAIRQIRRQAGRRDCQRFRESPEGRANGPRQTRRRRQERKKKDEEEK